MRIGICVFLIISCALIFISCNTTEPPPPPDGEKPTLELKLEDVSCTEAWIELTTTNLQLPTTVTLKQFNPTGDTLSQDFILTTQDSLLYIDSLLPNTNYNYQSFNQSKIKSNELSVTTIDTTSNNFTFETFTFGGTAGTSTLYDVAIVGEEIWAVGEIYVADTSQNGYTIYTAVHWDGSEWKLMRIKTNACGGVEYPPIQAIFAFSSNDILFAHIDGSITHYNGIEFTNNCSLITQLNGSANKIWGISKNDFYVVSGNGFMAWYNDTRWTRIESGTDLNINDIWGIADSNGEFNKYLAADNTMLKIDAINNLSRIDVESGMSIISVWGISNRLIYTAGDGVVLYKNYSWEKIDRPDVNTIYRIRGKNYNDVFGIGGPGSIIYHFNGYSWKSINPNPNYRYWRIEIKGDIIAASGYQGEKAAITVLRRNN
jgi:hypothetical protein